MKITNKFYVIILFLLINIIYGKNVNREVNNDGDFVDSYDDYVDNVDVSAEVEESVPAKSSGLKVTFRNNYKFDISLFWDGGSETNQAKIGDIPGLKDIVVNTFDQHVFYATKLNSREKLAPNRITVLSSKDLYHIGPVEVKKTKNPYVKYLNAPTTSMNAKFRCLIPDTINIWYEDGKGGSPQGSLSLGKEYTVNTYEGHVFYFTSQADKSIEYARFTMDKEKVVYLVTDPERPAPENLIKLNEDEAKFSEEYYNRTGIKWRHYFGPNGPRPPPTLFMWPTNEIGEIHYVDSTAGKWICNGPAAECQSNEPVQLELEVISQQPKVFIIKDFLSEFEVEEIIRIAIPLQGASQVGNVDGGGARKSDTRTSKNSWIPRTTSDVTETISKRAADLLQIDEARLSNRYAEDMQVVHYLNGQRYDSHHDWGVSGYPESRYITLLFYLTDMKNPNAGGETAFPKAAGGTGIKVHPGKGSAVLFYNLLEDGNGDDLALHAALPVVDGEKWLANFWVWDPKRK